MVSGQISADLVEWLAADQKVCSKWRALGRRLGLGPHLALVPGVWGVTPGSRRRGQTDRQCLVGLMRLWQDRRPDTYNIKTLKWLLAAEGLHDMWMWVNMMTQESPLKTEVTNAVYSRVASPTSPSSPSSNRVGSVSPFSSHLYSPSSNSSQDPITDGTRNHSAGGRDPTSYSREPLTSYSREPTSSYSRDPPSSPYSAFFRPTPSPCSTYQDYSPYPSLSSSPASSRPPSRGSCTSDMRPASQSSDYMRGTGGGRQGAASCPSTPLSHRRMMGDWSSLTSPGSVRSPTSAPYRSTSCGSSTPVTGRKGVYDLLYRPDLIKLSSPMNWGRAKREAQESGNSPISWGRSRHVSETGTRHAYEPRSRHGSGTMSPQSRLQSSGSATPRSRHQSEEASRGTWHQNGWHQNEELTSSRSRHRSEEWEQNPPVRGQEILQVREEVRLQEAGRQLQEACNSLLQECNQESPRSVRTQLHIAVADKRPFNVKKVQSIQLDQLNSLDSPIVTSKKGTDTPPIVMPSPKKGSNNTYSEYFDNLLSLIDKAAKDLSL